MAVFETLAVYLTFSMIGAVTRALFGLYKSYHRKNLDRVVFRSFLIEIIASLFFGTFASLILQEIGWLDVSIEITSMISGFFGADLLSIVSKKIGLKGKLSVKMAEEVFEHPELNQRQVNGMRYLEKNGRITNDIYQNLNGITHSSAKYDLKRMLELKKIRKKGNGRGTYYIPVNG